MSLEKLAQQLLALYLGTIGPIDESVSKETFIDFLVAQLCAEPGFGPAPLIGWYQARAAFLSHHWAVALKGEPRESQTTSDALELEHWQESQAAAREHRLTSVELEAGQLEIVLSGAVTMLVATARKIDGLARDLAEQRARGDAGMRLDQLQVEQACMLAGITRVGLEDVESTLGVLRSEKKEC